MSAVASVAREVVSLPVKQMPDLRRPTGLRCWCRGRGRCGGGRCRVASGEVFIVRIFESGWEEMVCRARGNHATHTDAGPPPELMSDALQNAPPPQPYVQVVDAVPATKSRRAHEVSIDKLTRRHSAATPKATNARTRHPGQAS